MRRDERTCFARPVCGVVRRGRGAGWLCHDTASWGAATLPDAWRGARVWLVQPSSDAAISATTASADTTVGAPVTASATGAALSASINPTNASALGATGAAAIPAAVAAAVVPTRSAAIRTTPVVATIRATLHAAIAATVITAM